MSKKCLYIAETSIPLSLCDDNAIISYQEHKIEIVEMILCPKVIIFKTLWNIS